MNIRKLVIGAGILALFCTQSALFASEKINTDWLQATPGDTGKTLGAEVINVEQDGDLITIDVDIPIEDLEHYETIEIFGKNATSPVLLEQKPKLLREDGAAYGIRFQMKRIPGFEFRLRLSDSSDEMIQ